MKTSAEEALAFTSACAYYNKHTAVKGIHNGIDSTFIATPMPPLPFFLEKQIFEFRFPNHVLHPGLIVTPVSPKPKDEIY